MCKINLLPCDFLDSNIKKTSGLKVLLLCAHFRREIQVEKGMSVGDFLKGAREQLAKEFREMRAVSVDNLMFVKVPVNPPRKAVCVLP